MEEYSEREQEFIINLGLYIYKKNKEHFKTISFDDDFETSTSNILYNSEIEKYKKLINTLEKELEEYSNQKLQYIKEKQELENKYITENNEIITNIKNEYNNRIQELEEIKEENEERIKYQYINKIQELEEKNNEVIENIKDNYNIKIQELEEKNNYYSNIEVNHMREVEELRKQLDKQYYDLKLEHVEEIEELNIRFNEENYNIKQTLEEKYNTKIDKLEEEIKNYNIKIDDIRKNLKEEHNKDINYYKEQINNITLEKTSLLELFNKNLEDGIEKQTQLYKEENEKLEKENLYYKKLYEDKNKGKFYEIELFKKLEEVNEKNCGNKWRIEHVGSSCSEKCDFYFQNKESGYIILLDTKNNQDRSSVRNTDIEKFIRDIKKKENNAIGGILLANSSISKKTKFEIDEIDGKSLLYVSNFSFDNVDFIFSLLDMIINKHKLLGDKFDIEELRNKYKNDYKFIKERLNTLNNEKKKFDNKLNEIKNEYNSKFNEDIEISLSTNTTKKENLNTNIIDFTNLEKNKKIIGKPSNYYLEYTNEKGENILQYFKGNYELNKKKEVLEKKDNTKIQNFFIKK